MVSSVGVPLLVGTELGRLSAMAKDDGILIPVGGDVGRLPAVVMIGGDVPLVA